jgi:hypothetical protein
MTLQGGSGNVGIGTISPTATLDVVGNAKVSGSLTVGSLANNTVFTAAIADNSITAVKIADSNVTTAKIADNNVTAVKIADSNVTTAKIADNNVTAVKIADSNVTSTKVADGAITDAKITGPVSAAKLDLSTVVSKVGDTMSGPLNLPSNGLVVGTNQLVVSNGNLGIGTSTPNRRLHLAQNNAVELSLQVPNGLADWRTWNLIASGGAGLAQNLTLRMINDAGTASVRDLMVLSNTGNVTVLGANNWDLTGTEGDFRIGNGTYRLKIGVPTTGGGAGDIAIKADGGLSRLNLLADGGIISKSNTTGVGLQTINTTGIGLMGSTGNNISLYGVNTSIDAPSVEGWNQGTGDIFRGWSGVSGTQALKFRVLNSGNIIANGVNYTSDLRLKTNIQPLENSLDKILRLRGVSYLLKSDESGGRKIGVIAQELEQEYPELVATDEKGMKSVAYANLTAVLIEAVKELEARKDAEITTLRNENNALKSRMERIEQLILSK